MRPGADGDRRVAVGFAALGAVVVSLTAAGATLGRVRPQGDPRVSFPGDRLLGGLVRYDSGWYLGIAERGYSLVPGRQSSVAYFPLYPLVIRALTVVVGDRALAGIAVSLVAGCLAAVGVARWMRLQGMAPPAVDLGVAALLLSPYAWYLYGVVYSDAVFLALTVGAALAVERRRPWLAALCLVGATADRATGLAVVVGLTVTQLERSGVLSVPDGGRLALPTRVDLSRLRPRDLAPLVGFAGIGGFATMLAVRFDDPLAFLHAQRAWGQGSGVRTLLKAQYVWELTHFVHRSLVATTTLQALIVLAAVVVAPAVARRFGWGYALIQLGVAAMVLVGSKDFMGSGRYLLVAFPMFALAGERLAGRPRSVRVAVLAIGATGLAVGALAFGHGVYLA